MRKFVFFGDSITEIVGVTHLTKGFVFKIEKKLKCVTFNYGVSGSRISITRPLSQQRPGLSFLDRLSDLPLDADKVIVFGGTNDFGQPSACPLGKEGEKTPKTFWGATRILLETLLKNYKKEALLFILPLPRRETIHHIPNDLGFYLEDYMDILRKQCEKYGVKYVDYFKNFSKIWKYSNDLLHPNNKGNTLLTKLLIKELK